MALEEKDYQRVAIHEASHAVVAVYRGYYVFALMLDGPEEKPGAVWRETPPGQSVENSPEWAQKEVGVAMAGSFGEIEFYGKPDFRFIEGAGGDRGQAYYAAVWAVADDKDIGVCRLSGLDSSEWKEKLKGRLNHYKKYQEIIDAEKKVVAETVGKLRGPIETVAKQLLQFGNIPGKTVYDAMGVPWPGKKRTTEWKAS